MLNPTLRDLFGRWIIERTPASFLAARSALLALPTYDPFSAELDAFDAMLQAKDWGGIQELALECIDNWMLTPYLHGMLGLACKMTGDVKRSELETSLFHACAEGILTTGDGSRKKPYLVVREDDAYGVLEYLDRSWSDVQYQEGPAGPCLVLVDEAGKGTWFDLRDIAAAAPAEEE